MNVPPIQIVSAGMVCGVGLNAASACAAIRSAIDNFQETRFLDQSGEWVIGSNVPLDQPWQGRSKLTKMASKAITECLAKLQPIPAAIPLLLCISERERPGRTSDLESKLFQDIESDLGYHFHNTDSMGIPLGRASVALALKHARKLLYEHNHEHVLIAGVDSLLSSNTLSIFEDNLRILSSQNPDGFIPGEAGSAILVSKPSTTSDPQLLCLGVGFGEEHATVEKDLPLKAEGLTSAINTALAESQFEMSGLDFRITDISGEQYYFKEATLALARTLRKVKDNFYMWHPADCIGEVGAAIGPILMAVALAGCKKSYTHGDNILCHFSNDAGQRAAAVLQYRRHGA